MPQLHRTLENIAVQRLGAKYCNYCGFRTVANKGEQYSGGRGGIRTHGTLAGTPVFKTGALNRSATLPNQEFQSLSLGRCRTQRELGHILGANDDLPRNPAIRAEKSRSPKRAGPVAAQGRRPARRRSASLHWCKNRASMISGRVLLRGVVL